MDRIYPESQSMIDMIFSLRQLQEKCREQRKLLYIAFINMTKAFEFVNRNILFQIFKSIGFPPNFLSMINSFHKSTKDTIIYDGLASKLFDICCRVKQGCILAPNIVWHILFGPAEAYFQVCYREHVSQDKVRQQPVQPPESEGKIKVSDKMPVWVLVGSWCCYHITLSEHQHHLMNRFHTAWQCFGLMISLKKTQVLGQGVNEMPSVLCHDQKLTLIC